MLLNRSFLLFSVLMCPHLEMFGIDSSIIFEGFRFVVELSCVNGSENREIIESSEIRLSHLGVSVDWKCCSWGRLFEMPILLDIRLNLPPASSSHVVLFTLLL